MTHDEKENLRNFLGKYIRNVTLRDTDNVFSLGFLNSLFAMELILYLEREMAVKLENSDLDIENLQSIDAISQFVTRKRSQSAAST